MYIAVRKKKKQNQNNTNLTHSTQNTSENSSPIHHEMQKLIFIKVGFSKA